MFFVTIFTGSKWRIAVKTKKSFENQKVPKDTARYHPNMTFDEYVKEYHKKEPKQSTIRAYMISTIVLLVLGLTGIIVSFFFISEFCGSDKSRQ